jgi:hypothetical protein
MKKKYGLFLLVLAILVLAGMNFVNWNLPGSNRLQAWNIYRGEMWGDHGEYLVEIDESDYGKGFDRVVRLYHKKYPYREDTSRFASVTGFANITGYDYNGDGNWDRISSCDTEKKCDLFYVTSSGKWKFSPADRDEPRLRTDLEGQKLFAEACLNKAVTAVRQMQFRVGCFGGRYTED